MKSACMELLLLYFVTKIHTYIRTLYYAYMNIYYTLQCNEYVAVYVA